MSRRTQEEKRLEATFSGSPSNASFQQDVENTGKCTIIACYVRFDNILYYSTQNGYSYLEFPALEPKHCAGISIVVYCSIRVAVIETVTFSSLEKME